MRCKRFVYSDVHMQIFLLLLVWTASLFLTCKTVVRACFEIIVTPFYLLMKSTGSLVLKVPVCNFFCTSCKQFIICIIPTENSLAPQNQFTFYFHSCQTSLILDTYNQEIWKLFVRVRKRFGFVLDFFHHSKSVSYSPVMGQYTFFLEVNFELQYGNERKSRPENLNYPSH